MSTMNPEIARLLAILKAGGDPRLGGSLPMGGKANAWSTKGPSKPANGMFLTVPAAGKAEDQGHDAYMNFIESLLEAQLQPSGQTIPWRPK